MKFIGILPFRVGASTSQVIEDRIRHFYESVARQAWDSPISLANPNETTIPVPLSNIKDSVYVDKTMKAALQPLQEATTQLLVDFAIAPRIDTPILELVLGVINYLKNQWGPHLVGREVFMLLPYPLSESDTLLKISQSQLESGQIRLVDSLGTVFGKRLPRNFEAKQYRDSLRAAQGDKLALLEQKIIRRVGVFKHQKQDKTVQTSHYYDGRLCADEIMDLIDERIEFNTCSSIISYAPISPWFDKIASAVSIRHKLPQIDASGMLDNRAESIDLSEMGVRPLVLCPLVDTGDSLSSINEKIRMIDPSCVPNYLSVLATSTIKSRSVTMERGALQIPDLIRGSDAKLEVGYLLEVNRVLNSEESACTESHCGSSFDIEAEPAELTSYAFWKMVSDAGVMVDEANVPMAWRKSLRLVPDTRRIVEQNAPLIAYKLNAMLSNRSGLLPVDPTIVCPAQRGAQELAHAMRSMFKYPVIDIPDDIIENIDPRSEKAAFEEILDNNKEMKWCQDLNSAANGGRTRVLILVEFNVSGGTIERLRGLCAAARLVPEIGITIVDFALDRRTHDLDVMSLYSLGIVSAQ